MFELKFVPNGRGKAQCEADPAYPNGIALDATNGTDVSSCFMVLPYPAPECGIWEVECSKCGLTVVITAAGRADDPCSVRLACKQVVTLKQAVN